jgi:hypothetical protein
MTMVLAVKATKLGALRVWARVKIGMTVRSSENTKIFNRTVDAVTDFNTNIVKSLGNVLDDTTAAVHRGILGPSHFFGFIALLFLMLAL